MASDGGAVSDAGVASDGGAVSDAGVASDGGAVSDAGVASDGGVADGGTAVSGYVWVTSFGPDSAGHAGSVYRVSKSADTATPFPVGHSPLGVAVDRESVWVGNDARYDTDYSVMRIDKATGAVVTIPVTASPAGIAVDEGSAWVTIQNAFNGQDPKLLRIDKGTNQVAATITGLSTRSNGVAVDREFVWVSSYDDGTVAKVSKATESVITKINTPGTNATSIAVDADSVWVTGGAADQVRRIDKATLAVTSISGFSGPAGIALDGSAVWVANFNGASVSKIARSTNTIAATIPVGTEPDGLCLDATSVWAANFGSDTVSRILKSTESVVATIPVPRPISLGDATGFAFDALFPAAGGGWTMLRSPPAALFYASAGAVNGTVYVTGGQNNNALYAYDRATDSWATKAPMPTARFFAGAAVVGDKLYVIGGCVGGSCTAVTNVVEEYGATNNQWTTKTAMPTPRSNLTAVEIGGKVYAVGGNDGYGAPTPGAFFDKVEVYDPVMNTWTTKTPLPAARTNHAAAALGGKLYVVGGQTANGAQCTGCGDVLAYDPTGNSWATKASLPVLRVSAIAAALGSVLHVVGGQAQGDSQTLRHDTYDPGANLWSSAAPARREHIAGAGAVVGGKLYVMGGYGTGSGNDVMEVFAP